MQNNSYDEKNTYQDEKTLESEDHIVRFIGGLGNQLFQFGLYKAFEQMGYPTFADTKELRNGRTNRDYQLEYLGINVVEAEERLIRKYYCCDNKILRAIIKRVGKPTYFRQRDLIFDSSILGQKYGYFDGYWQSYKYFEHCADAVKSSIVFPDIAYQDKIGKDIFGKIKEKFNSVSVHIRLGDYLELYNMYGGICTIEYYEKAMDYISNALVHRGEEYPTFFVFSNDINGAKELLHRNDIIYVEGHSEEQGYVDMNLMHLCRHHIIANSSFSWWGAFLGQYEDTITIAPSKWINNIKNESIIPESWIKV